MKTYNTLIIEDDPSDQTILKQNIQRLPYLTVTGVFANPLHALPILADRDINLLFLDASLPDMNGLAFLESITHRPNVILVTADPSYAIAAFEVGVADYVVKPYTFARLVKAVDRALGHRSETPVVESNPYIFLKMGREFTRILVNDIQFIEAFGAFSKVYTPTDVMIVSELLSDLHAQLPEGSFLRIHKSYIVAKQNVMRISARFITINKNQLPIGAKYRQEVEKSLR
ncbi:LytR/AlgR family response regulator transcription factor [Spirosoma montaniterrae]|uniref:Two-component system response regulator n=1 Tax=Spirosoma montaniterrae TaxID=1178516 RepID=A0A1P9WVM3_9BACT|nr:LytTR family DNA-binding domain-containing protein [Spirosoma montaniterrae]AQG79435.1 hypothetical protein AWR27_08945 [Spirosoma montaniterrae]